jgi:hypothetical protein
MKLKLSLITLGGLLLLGITNVKAQATTSSFTPSHIESAENFLIATGVNTKFPAIIENIVAAFSKQIPEDNRAAFADVMRKFMSKYYTWDILKVDLDKMYAAEFTEDELKQMSDFYSSPVGKKYAEKSVELLQQSMQIGQQVVVNHRPELEQMMKDAMGSKN